MTNELWAGPGICNSSCGIHGAFRATAVRWSGAGVAERQGTGRAGAPDGHALALNRRNRQVAGEHQGRRETGSTLAIEQSCVRGRKTGKEENP